LIILNPKPESGNVDLVSLIWPRFNASKKSVFLRDSSASQYEIKPGERLILPKQVEFLRAMDLYDAVLYGGSMGSGKSHILRWSCIKFLLDRATEDHVGVRVGLFCSTYKAIEDRHLKEIERSFPKWLGYYHGKANEFRLYPEFGSGIIQFRNLDDPDKYKSVEFAMAAIDEVTEIEEAEYDFLATRLRWPGIEHSPILCATNPTGRGAAWVRRRFVDSKTRDKAKLNPETGYVSKGNYFIQALPTDNPTLPAQYLDALYKKPPKLRDAYFYGHWDVFEGQFYDLVESVHLVKRFEMPREWSSFLSVDQGYAHPCAAIAARVDFEGTLWVGMDYSAVRLSPLQNKHGIAHRIAQTGFDLTEFLVAVGDPSMWKSDGSFERNRTPGEIYNASDDEIGSFQLLKANNDRIAGWQALLEGFNYEQEDDRDRNGNLIQRLKKKPKIRIFDDCHFLWSSLRKLQHDDRNPEDVRKTTGEYPSGEGDDESDALRYLYMAAGRSEYTAPESMHDKIFSPRADILDIYEQTVSPMTLAS
jgi:hypothetical protein